VALPVLFTAPSYGAAIGGPAHFDVSLEDAFTITALGTTASLELNPGDPDEPASVELTRENARILRDALDALLGEQRATIPSGFSGVTR